MDFAAAAFAVAIPAAAPEAATCTYIIVAAALSTTGASKVAVASSHTVVNSRSPNLILQRL